MRDFGMQGRWWLPDSPENAVHGELSLSSRGGLRLELQRDVAISREAAWRVLGRPILWGEVDGRPITLVGASADVVWIDQNYNVREAYIGGHFTEAPSFQKFSLELSDLDSFLGVNAYFATLGLKDVNEVGELLTVVTPTGTISFIQDAPLRESFAKLPDRARTHRFTLRYRRRAGATKVRCPCCQHTWALA